MGIPPLEMLHRVGAKARSVRHRENATVCCQYRAQQRCRVLGVPSRCGAQPVAGPHGIDYVTKVPSAGSTALKSQNL